MTYTAVDLFAGCGGMTEGLFEAGFNVIAAVEIDEFAARAYRANNDQRGVHFLKQDIRTVDTAIIAELLHGEQLHLLAGCPPCQGFSTMRRKNKKRSQRDARNRLIWEYVRFVEELRPLTIMLENVPALAEYTEFKKALSHLKRLGYNPKYMIANVADFGVPQRRKRLVMLGSLLGEILPIEGQVEIVTVRDTIGNLEPPEESNDPVHRIFPHHTPAVQRRIELTPHDGGSRADLPDEYTLECHRREGIGFRDVYGRLSWDRVSSTITGGCLNPSKGRFLHPEQDRCISAREASLLQTFPRNYIFPEDIPLAAIALVIGNALPPEFCKRQAEHIEEHLNEVFMSDVFDSEKRSEIMKKIKNKGTSPEIYVRELLCEMGFKYYRLKSPTLPCNPDIIFHGKKKAIFINGCFWHGHTCNRGHLPESNRYFWKKKIETNQKRDSYNYKALAEMGWNYLVIWQCEIKVSKRDELKDNLLRFMQ
ncbi:MAG: cytosine methyltransferase [Peptococcaceae bacterium BRH_c4b]|nr:MAG: cytosine methyltransferase [Peptococcaceae bacterium BRH_c4b]